MEKLRNTLSNDTVRGRQSTIYRAQRIAEFTLYDGDPHLFDHELDYYLKVTAAEIKAVTAKYLDIENRVVLDVIPAMATEASETTAPASPQPGGNLSNPQRRRQIEQPPSATKTEDPLGDSCARARAATASQSHRLQLNLAQDQYTREYESTG